jgi:HAD superfamily hydrolase (TIGR01662 family)
MIKAVLFDLDDTLLSIDSVEFVIRYMTLLAGQISEQFPGLNTEQLRPAMRGAVRAIVESKDPTLNNHQVFVASLANTLALPQPDLQALLSAYDNGAYLSLQNMIQPVAGAATLLQDLYEAGYAVVIATNPLFSRAAVLARMAWAGLPLDLPYALITNSQESHFAKPTPHYYEEILARVGAEPDEAIMVGDSSKNDMWPADSVGMYRYWVQPANPSPDPHHYEDMPPPNPHSSGSLAQFAEKVAAGWLKQLPEEVALPAMRPANLAPRLIGDVAALYALMDTVQNPAHWLQRPDPNEWSGLEVVAHLRDSEGQTQRPLLARIASEENPFLVQAPPPPGPGQMALAGVTPEQAAADFWAARQQTLAFLQGLPSTTWQRPARHSIFGNTTLLEMALFTARHDHLHLHQLCHTLGRCKEQ